MVTTLYIMKLNETRINMEEYYTDLYNTPLLVFSKHLEQKNKCRVCLQDGDIPMTKAKNPNDIKEAMKVFADIEFNDDPKHQANILCYVCYKFLKIAILFRKVAQRTNKTLAVCLQKTSKLHKNSPQTLKNVMDDFQDNLGNLSGGQEDKTDDINLDIDGVEEIDEECTKTPCPICQKVLSKSYYKKHMDLHNPDVPAQHVCDVCGKAFKLKEVYNRHKERHETRYIFKCELCPYAGRYRERLWMHMRVHTGELKYLCTECPARYTTGGSLSDHIKLKHTEPQYKCNSCDKAYHNNLNLQRHIDTAHLGIKDHECNVCGKTFGYRKKMLDHQRKIHKMVGLRPNVVRKKKKVITINSE